VCWHDGHIFLAIIGVLFIFFGFGIFPTMILASQENPYRFLRVDMYYDLIFRTIGAGIVLTSVFFGSIHMGAVLAVMSFFFMLQMYLVCRFRPYHFLWANHLKAGLTMFLLGACLSTCVCLGLHDENNEIPFILFWCSFILGYIGYLVSECLYSRKVTVTPDHKNLAPFPPVTSFLVDIDNPKKPIIIDSLYQDSSSANQDQADGTNNKVEISSWLCMCMCIIDAICASYMFVHYGGNYNLPSGSKGPAKILPIPLIWYLIFAFIMSLSAMALIYTINIYIL